MPWRHTGQVLARRAVPSARAACREAVTRSQQRTNGPNGPEFPCTGDGARLAVRSTRHKPAAQALQFYQGPADRCPLAERAPPRSPASLPSAAPTLAAIHRGMRTVPWARRLAYRRSPHAVPRTGTARSLTGPRLPCGFPSTRCLAELGQVLRSASRRGHICGCRARRIQLRSVAASAFTWRVRQSVTPVPVRGCRR